jgi:hypothetical protein
VAGVVNTIVSEVGVNATRPMFFIVSVNATQLADPPRTAGSTSQGAPLDPLTFRNGYI